MPPKRFENGIGELKLGEAGLFKLKQGSSLEIRFVGLVSDSRCPKGAVCVWEGEVEVQILLDGKTTKNIKTEIEYQGFKIVLMGVMPYPETGKSIPLSDYSIQLKVVE